MPKQKYVAVTPSYQWLCCECGSDMNPSSVSYHMAVVRRYGTALRAGRILQPAKGGNEEIDRHIDGDVESPTFECADCGEPYDAEPAEDSIAHVVEEEGVSSLEIELPEGTEITYLVCGGDGELYGLHGHSPAGDGKKFGFLDPEKPYLYVKPTLLVKNNSLVWNLGEDGVTLPPDILTEEVRSVASNPCKMASGEKDVDPGYFLFHNGLADQLDEDLVFWVREDLLGLATSIRSGLLSALVRMHDSMAWWLRGNVGVLDIVNHADDNWGAKYPMAKVPPAPAALPVPKKKKKAFL